MKRNHFKLGLAAIIAAGTLLQVPGFAAASTLTQAEVVNIVNFRTSPSTNSSVIKTLKKGTDVILVSKVNSSWYKIKVDGRLGYVSTSTKYIKVVKTESNTESQKPEISIKPKPAPSPKPTLPPLPNNQPDAIGEAFGEKVIKAGEKYLGTPYKYSDSRSDKRYMDCSDFTYNVFKDVGIKLPTNSRSQSDFVKKNGTVVKDVDNLKVGDLIFMKASASTKNTRITHVAIYAGNNKILHTYGSGGVRYSTFKGTNWEKRVVNMGRPFKG